MNKMVSVLVGGIALASVALASCGTVANSAKPDNPVSIAVGCDEFQTAQRPAAVHWTADLASGQTLSVTLCSNPATGFSWEDARIDDASVLQQVNHEAAGAAKDVAGAAGTENWTFKALKKGAATVSIDYSRPWEGGEKGIWKFTLDVAVDGAAAPAKTATPAPTSSPVSRPADSTRHAEYGNVTLSYDQSMADSVNGRTMPEQDGSMVQPWGIAPEHVRLDFQGYPVTSRFAEPSILVLPVERYKELLPQAGAQIETLRALLRDRPELYSTYSPNPLVEQNTGEREYGSVIPQLPPVNAAKMLSVKMQYLDFQNGSGVRSVVAFSQGPLPIEKSMLIYTFQGLTADGKYYISATFPVIPTTELPAPPANWREREDAAQIINELNSRIVDLLDAGDTGYQPNLTILDKAIMSLTVR